MDIMHDILEGLLPYEVKELFKHFIQAKIITRELINEAIQNFPYGYHDIKDKPSIISSTTLASSDHSLKQSGIHTHAHTHTSPLSSSVPASDI